MPDDETQAGAGDLQFDRVVTTTPAAPADIEGAVMCTVCQTSIETEYYDVNGHVVCARCRTAIESNAEVPRGIIPLVIAGLFGLGAGIAGAIIYYAVIAIAHLEIGIVAILIGYMVGYAVRKGARGRGGLRFQVLAVALTYASIALAYTPIAVKQVIDADRQAQKTSSTTNSRDSRTQATSDSQRALPSTPGGAGIVLGSLFLVALMLALPVLVVVGSLPYGLISAFIIAIGMRQAWKMTGTPWVQTLGPYRVGAAQASVSA